MRVALFGLCVIAFALLLGSPAAQASCRDYPSGHACSDYPAYDPCGSCKSDAPYWKGYRSYHQDDDWDYPDPYPCGGCYPDYPKHDACYDCYPKHPKPYPCHDCYPPYPKPPYPKSPRCIQDTLDPGFSLNEVRVNVSYAPVLAPDGREICHFRLGDTVWVPRSCARGSWCGIAVSQSRSEGAIFLPR